MSVLEFVLDGLEKALELERELGVKSVECDRSLLAAPVAQVEESPQTKFRSPSSPALKPSPDAKPQPEYDFVFLHDGPLSDGGVEMMAKIITALGKTAETAPIIVEMPVPKARIYVVLGRDALKKFLPDVKGAPGQWIKSGRGRDVLITYSPEHILRFGTVTPAVKKIKEEMWLSLKAVKQRISL